MRPRIARLAALTAALVLAAPAVAAARFGQGIINGNDKNSTYAGFIIIALFPAIALVFSVAQGKLQKRKDERLETERDRRASAQWRGGW